MEKISLDVLESMRKEAEESLKDVRNCVSSMKSTTRHIREKKNYQCKEFEWEFDKIFLSITDTLYQQQDILNELKHFIRYVEKQHFIEMKKPMDTDAVTES